MAQNSDTIEILNDLILINNDRIAGYEKAEAEAGSLENDLRSMFSNLAEESRRNVLDLQGHVTHLGGEPATGTMLSGKLYRVWMDIKATFTGHDRTSVLESCEYGEDAAQEAYDDALATDADLPVDIRQLIANQKAGLLESHNLIKKYRDLHQAVN